MVTRIIRYHIREVKPHAEPGWLHVVIEKTSEKPRPKPGEEPKIDERHEFKIPAAHGKLKIGEIHGGKFLELLKSHQEASKPRIDVLRPFKED